MHDDTSGKILNAHFGKPTTSPNPVADGGVDKHEPERGKDDYGAHLHALNNGTNVEGRSNNSEGHLEHDKERLG